jgi:hypothetical protein
MVLRQGEVSRVVSTPCADESTALLVEDVGSGLYIKGCRHLVVEKGLQAGWGGAQVNGGMNYGEAGGAVASGEADAGLSAPLGPEAWTRACSASEGSEAAELAPATPPKTFVPATIVLRGQLSAPLPSTSDQAAPLQHAALEVVEALSPAAASVPASGRQWLVTGPNVAGKSTVLRSAAQTVLLAQSGSFVPARQAVIGVADRLFARVGASDDLARERSTFLVEMEETAAILQGATAASLVIVDELGRGTSAEDGLAVAAATLSELSRPAASPSDGGVVDGDGCRVLFATHFQELAATAPASAPACAAQVRTTGGGGSERASEAEGRDPPMSTRTSQLSGALNSTVPASPAPCSVSGCACAQGSVRCMTMEVWMQAAADSASSNSPVFSYRVIPGVAKASLGLEAAKRAGVPQHVVDHAATLLQGLRA